MNAPVFLQCKVTFTQRHKRKCYNIDLFWFAKEIKIIRVKSQANKPPCVSATRRKLLYPRRHAFSFRTALWKLFCFQRLLQYSNLFTYSGLKWSERWIWRYSLHVGFRFGLFSQPVSRQLCYLGETMSSIQDPSTPHNGKTIRGRPV